MNKRKENRTLDSMRRLWPLAVAILCPAIASAQNTLTNGWTDQGTISPVGAYDQIGGRQRRKPGARRGDWGGTAA